MITRTFFLAGLGNIGLSLLDMLQSRVHMLRERHNLQLSCVGVADSRGSLMAADGIDIAAVIAAKRTRQPLSILRGTWQGNRPPADALDVMKPDMVIDSTPLNLVDGEPGMTLTRRALALGVDVVTANKAPLALAYAELSANSYWGGGRPKLRFSACLGGGLPTINVGMFDLTLARFTRVEAILNATTQVILEGMSNGGSYADALQTAQRMGIAEADPTNDVDGWDAACKLVILANSVLRQPTTLRDLAVRGIGPHSAAGAAAARAAGGRLSLVATAAWDGAKFALQVAPLALAADHPFAALKGAESGVLFESDLFERTVVISRESGPLPSAAAVLRDMIHMCSAHPLTRRVAAA